VASYGVYFQGAFFAKVAGSEMVREKAAKAVTRAEVGKMGFSLPPSPR